MAGQHYLLHCFPAKCEASWEEEKKPKSLSEKVCVSLKPLHLFKEEESERENV